MASQEWETREPTGAWSEEGNTDRTAAEGQDDFREELEAVAARIDRFSSTEAGALTLYYLTLEDISPEAADKMLSAFGHRSPAGFAGWLNDNREQRLMPFDAYVRNASDLDSDQKQFVADTIAESITYADQRRYMSIILDPSRVRTTAPNTATDVEAAASALSRELIRNREALAESLLLTDIDGYLEALQELERGNRRMDSITEN